MLSKLRLPAEGEEEATGGEEEEDSKGLESASERLRGAPASGGEKRDGENKISRRG